MRTSAWRLVAAGVGVMALAAVCAWSFSPATFAECHQGCAETAWGCVSLDIWRAFTATVASTIYWDSSAAAGWISDSPEERYWTDWYAQELSCFCVNEDCQYPCHRGDFVSYDYQNFGPANYNPRCVPH